MVEKEAAKKRGRSSSSSSSSSSGSSSSGSSSSGSGSRSSSSSSSSRSRSRSPRRRENRPIRGGRSRSPIRRGSPPRGARADRGGGRPSPSPPRRRHITPSPPRRGGRDRSGSRQRRRSPPARRSSPMPARSSSPIKRIIIKNLSKNVIREHVEEIFSIYGAIAKVDLPPDRNHTHIHRGYGYVDYQNVEDAEKSIKYMDGGQVDGQIIQVEMTIGRQQTVRRQMSPIRRRASPPPRDRDRDRKSPIRRGGGGNYRNRSPPRRRSPMGGRGSGANNMPLGPSRFRRGSRSRSPINRRSRS
ncbi:hypothetical protein L5515_002890 [Caenorhabditis briggsae]|uniref:RRM domain-containing protein n=1 Tax=Caenorhabditis briggsae TaxID=6238 RepID=A0AAE9JA25_CAEBR|nr:hypothetical protein L3Y34_000005 [Caenorhabditis briggsae]UMM21026.1 hypothetical protein L5515_002890 [Caenorhabditis briggsae]